jgi:multidrug resistance efflux pump
MSTLAQLNQKLRSAIAEESKASAANREANAAVVAATSKLPPYWVTTSSAAAERERVRPLIDRAQKASNRLFAATADLVNARDAVKYATAGRKPRASKRSSQRGSAKLGVAVAIGVAGAAYLALKGTK